MQSIKPKQGKTSKRLGICTECDMGKDGETISFRIDGELRERLRALVAANPLVKTSRFAEEAMRRGMASVETEYLSKPQSDTKTKKAA